MPGSSPGMTGVELNVPSQMHTPDARPRNALDRFVTDPLLTFTDITAALLLAADLLVVCASVVLRSQFNAPVEWARLVRGPGAELRIARSRGEIAIGVCVGHALDRTVDPHLAAQRPRLAHCELDLFWIALFDFRSSKLRSRLYGRWWARTSSRDA